MLSNDEITVLEVQLHKAKADKARWDAEVKAEVEHKAAKEKVAVEVKRVAEEKAVVEAGAQWRVASMLKAQAMEVEVRGVMEKVVAVAAARKKAMLEDKAR